MTEHRKALVVGIDDYPFSPLKGCVSDSVQIARLLEKHGDQRPNFEVKRLLSSEKPITKSLLKDAINLLFDDDPDIALLYFSGHGYLNSYGGYLVTTDFKKYDEGVSMSDILRLANNSKAKNKVVILDCCHSGSFAVPHIANSGFSELSDGLTVLTACRAHEASIEEGKGVFSALLIDALEGQCADLTGNILPSSIYAYIDRALGIWQQRPAFKTNVSRFVSLREVTPPVSLSILRKITHYFASPNDEYPLTPKYEFTHPGAEETAVAIFKELQKFESIGFVLPVGEEHMYFAAINSKSCKLTTLGKQYWNLVKSGKI